MGYGNIALEYGNEAVNLLETLRDMIPVWTSNWKHTQYKQIRVKKSVILNVWKILTFIKPNYIF